MPSPRPPTAAARAPTMPQPEEPAVPERDLLRALMEHLPDLIYF